MIETAQGPTNYNVLSSITDDCRKRLKACATANPVHDRINLIKKSPGIRRAPYSS